MIHTKKNRKQVFNLWLLIFRINLQLKHVVNAATSGKQLNRECSLFTNDSKHVIIGAATYILDENRPPFYDLYTSNDDITPTLRYVTIQMMNLSLKID